MIKGITLIELAVSLLILILLIAGIYGVLYVGQFASHTDIGQLLLQQQTRQGIYWMIKELREEDGSGIAISTEGDKITFSTIEESNIKYYRDTADANKDGITTQILREYPTGTYKILTNNISDLTFALSDDNKFVTIALKAEKNMLGRQLTFEEKAKIMLRNN